jgi:hypothetical protein
MIRGAPKLLLATVGGSQGTIVTTALEGIPLPRVLGRNSYRQLALLGTEWLVTLAAQTPVAPATERDRLLESAVEHFEAMFGRVIDPLLVRESRAVLETLGHLPVCCEQRDFAPWNLLVTPQHQLQVLDWESAELQGLPLMDLIYYTTYLAFYLGEARTPDACLESYRQTLQPSTLVGEVSLECQQLYIKRLGLPVAKTVPLRLLCWMLHSRSEYRRFAADAGGMPEPWQLRRSLFLGLWEEELRHLRQPGSSSSSHLRPASPSYRNNSPGYPE